MPPLVRLARPHQYTKNLLLFAAPGAAGMLDQPDSLWRAVLAFALFCAVSSAGYVANDLADATADRLHPKKRHRPIASGAVSTTTAQALLVALVAAAAACAPLLGTGFALLLGAYAVTTFVYSLAVKQVPWIELFIVSFGFLLRAAAGGAATDTALSNWFLTVVSAGALLVIAGKRLGELLTLGRDSASRPVLRHYSESTLRWLSASAGFIAVGAYATWAATAADDQAGGDGDLFLRLTTVPFVIAIARYLMMAWRGQGEAPDLLVLRDRGMIGAGVAWIALYAIGLYL